jgi:GST-like protein
VSAGGYELIGSLGCGSAIVETAFAVAGLPLRLTDLPYLEPGPGRDRLLSLNPLGQVPALVLPDGAVMTESAAMILHAADLAPDSGLAPPPGSPERARFLNLLVLFVASIYPTFTYGDAPEKWTEPGAPAALLRERTDERAKTLWRHVERTLTPAPFALGARMSALDLYLCAMTRWRPRAAWFQAEAPGLWAAQAAAARHPAVAAVMARHFPV